MRWSAKRISTRCAVTSITLASTNGLAASAYTGSLRKALRLSREIHAGVVTVNCFGVGDASTPFGGSKQSGLAGKLSTSSCWIADPRGRIGFVEAVE